jgi:hypothetical protein
MLYFVLFIQILFIQSVCALTTTRDYLGFKEYNFHEMNNIIDNRLKSTEHYNYNVKKGIFEYDIFKEHQYKYLTEAKNYIIKNIENPFSIFLGWRHVVDDDDDDDEFANLVETLSVKKTSHTIFENMCQIFVFISVNPITNIISTDIIVSNPEVNLNEKSQYLKQSLIEMSHDSNCTLKFENLKKISDLRWYLDFTF